MELEHIQQLRLDMDTINDVLRRLLWTPEWPSTEKLFTIDDDEEKTFYQRILVHESLAKPTLVSIKNEFAIWKQELIDVEQARLDRIAKVIEIKDKWSKIKDIRGAIYKLGLSIRNPGLELKRIIETEDDIALANLESASEEFILENKVKNDNKKFRNNIKFKVMKYLINQIEETENITSNMKTIAVEEFKKFFNASDIEE